MAAPESTATVMAPPQCSAASRIAIFVLRVLIFLLLLISLIVLAINTSTVESGGDKVKIRFNDISAYKYMIAAIVVGLAYSLLQLALSSFLLMTGHRLISGKGGILVDFYGEKVISYVLATGAAAGFGVTKDMMDFFDAAGLSFGTFYQKAYASASLLLLAFVCSAILSVLFSYALPKRV